MKHLWTVNKGKIHEESKITGVIFISVLSHTHMCTYAHAHSIMRCRSVFLALLAMDTYNGSMYPFFCFSRN